MSCCSGQLNILMSREQWLRTFYDFEESEEEEYDYPAAPIPPPRINTPLNAANLNVSFIFYRLVYEFRSKFYIRIVSMLQKSDIKTITERSCGLRQKRSLSRPRNIVNMLNMQKVWIIDVCCNVFCLENSLLF